MSVAALKDKAYGANYTFLKILQQYKFESDDQHYIFEGNDDQSFYFNYLQDVKFNVRTYISNGKPNSIDIYDKLDWETYDKKRIIFFIDRDYSRLLNERVPDDINIYETTFYSIENYISNKLILRRLINEILHYHEQENINQIIQIFESQYENFFKAIKPIIAWVLIIRSNNLKANLNQIDLAKVFQVDAQLNLVTLKLNKLKYLEKVTQVQTPSVGISVFRNWYEVIDGQPSKKLAFRGKFEAWYLLTFFNKVSAFLRDYYRFNSKVRTNINLANAIEIIGPRTVIPERLDTFIKSINL